MLSVGYCVQADMRYIPASFRLVRPLREMQRHPLLTPTKKDLFRPEKVFFVASYASLLQTPSRVWRLWYFAPSQAFGRAGVSRVLPEKSETKASSTACSQKPCVVT